MLTFEDCYFQDEEREGFLVTEEIKRLWAAQLVILDDIDTVCRRHGISWYTAWGTTLGAVRHKGYIPWDDDLDICMKRADYTRFLQVAEKELPSGYSLMNLHHDAEKGYSDLLTRVLNQRRFNLSEEHLRRFYGCPYIIGVDIFPLDYIPRDPEEYDFIRDLLFLVFGAAKSWGSEEVETEEQERIVRKIEEMCAVTFDRSGDMKTQLFQLTERLCSIYTEEDADDLGFMILQIDMPHFLFPKNCFEKPVYLPFENTSIPVPTDYRTVLERTYGDWQTPVRNWGTHDYPYYLKQKPILEKYKAMNGQ